MKFWAVVIFFIICNTLVSGQTCPDLTNPIAGSVNVGVDATISWEPVTGVTGYVISIGTTPNGTDIINQQAVGTATTFAPPVGLPDNTLVYVSITLFFFDQPDIVCTSQSFTTEDITSPPACSQLVSPLNGATDVNVASNITWTYVTGADGYIITVGTAPGLGDIANTLDVGNVLSFNPPADFPNDTDIYVEVIPYNENGNAGVCSEESFMTGPIAVLPSCTTIISPTDGEINVGLSPLIEWQAVPGATGYRVYIGSSPFDNDVLDGGAFTTNSTFVINFEANSVYFIRIVPFNAAGDALGCEQTSFSTVLGCGPYFDAVSGELVVLNPVLTLASEVGLCLNEVPTTIAAPDVADGYRWYQRNANGDFVIISQTQDVQISEEGEYMYEAYNNTSSDVFSTECPSSSMFTVVASEIATLQGANVVESASSLFVEVFVAGNGNYEYALDDITGPYQDSNQFVNAPEDASIVYIRDKNGCGITEFNIENYIRPNGFPKFFTPNDDGFNDHWQYKAGDDDGFILETIYIFDKYGKLLKTINPTSIGWNGTFNGEKLSTQGYWYKAITTQGESMVGYFTLKR